MKVSTKTLDVSARSVTTVLCVIALIVLCLPGGLLRRKGSDWLLKRDQRRIVADEWHEVTDGARVGNQGSTVIAVMFVDYTCPFCRMAQDTVTRFIERHPAASIVVRQRPKPGSHLSHSASLVASCALLQRGFPRMHRHLLEEHEWLEIAERDWDWEELGRDLGFQEDAIRECIGSNAATALLAEDQDFGSASVDPRDAGLSHTCRGCLLGRAYRTTNGRVGGIG